MSVSLAKLHVDEALAHIDLPEQAELHVQESQNPGRLLLTMIVRNPGVTTGGNYIVLEEAIMDYGAQAVDDALQRVLTAITNGNLLVLVGDPADLAVLTSQGWSDGYPAPYASH
ncbi:hypothetical protein ACFSC4_27810 [Deinococcus malanensis]|nr:hypothetical protein [Deinococcus malanensis]